MELFKKKNLEYTELFTEAAYVHLGPNNPLYYENKFKLKDYRNFPFVVCSYNYTDNFSAFFERSGFEPSSVIKVSTMKNVLNIVSTTNIIHLGLKLHSNLTFSSVISIPLNLDGYHFKVGLIENASTNLCEITSEFIEMIKNLER